MKIIFLRNLDNPDFYLIYHVQDYVDVEKIIHKMNHTGEYKNSGYPEINVELAYILKMDKDNGFFNFLHEKIATDHIDVEFYNAGSCKAWYKFEEYEPEKWKDAFDSYQRAKIMEFKKSQQGTQLSLF